MTSLSFGPQSVDINSYKGDTFLLSFEIVEADNSGYSNTGSWNMAFYDKSDNSLIDTDPSGISINPIGNGFNNKEFNYVATAAQTIFTGADVDANTLSYIVGTTSVYKNDVLIAGNQYTASNGITVLLASGAALNDDIRIECVSSITADGVAEISISNELSELLSNTASVVYEFYLDDGDGKYTFINGNVSITPRIFD
jgi:hypothetical protein